MSEVFFILGRAASFITTRDIFRGVLLASNEVRTEVLAHVEVVKLSLGHQNIWLRGQLPGNQW